MWKPSDIREILVYKREPRRIRRGSVSPEGEFMVFQCVRSDANLTKSI